MNIANRRITVDEFLGWAQAQPRGRFELIAGEIVEMAPERSRHALTKLEVALVLRQALAAAGCDGYQVYPDGMTVRIGEHMAFEPDCALEPRGLTADDAVELTAPLLVVEVLSPSTGGVDRGGKLAGYFEVESIAHYLIVDPGERVVTHYRRTGRDVAEVRIVRQGELVLDPPGITLDIAHFWPPQADATT